MLLNDFDVTNSQSDISERVFIVVEQATLNTVYYEAKTTITVSAVLATNSNVKYMENQRLSLVLAFRARLDCQKSSSQCERISIIKRYFFPLCRFHSGAQPISIWQISFFINYTSTFVYLFLSFD